MAPSAPSTSFDGFQVDFSSNGILPVKISLKVRPPGDEAPPDDPKKKTARKRKAGSAPPDPPYVETTVPLWLPIEVSDSGEEKTIPGTQYVSCRYQASIEAFITKDDFIARIPKDDGEHWAIYVEDWEAAKRDTLPDSLSCDGYDDYGAKLGTSGARSWPSRGFIAKDYSKDSDSPEVGARNLVLRYRAQAQIWRDVAVKYMSAGSSRLWKPTLWTRGTPIKIYFLPVGAWPTRKTLSTIVEKIKADAKKRESERATRRLPLTKWLDWEAPIEDSKIPTNLVKISRNLLNHYETFISEDDLEILLREQTQGSADWRRPWPTQASAESIQKDMLEKAKPNYKTLLATLREEVTSPIYPTKGPDDRVDAGLIMGGQSANQIAIKWWAPLPGGPKVVAEWLHRSAYSLGPLASANYQSPENIVFGSFEANSDMTRAELLVRTLRNMSGASGNLTTRVVNSDPQKAGDPELMFLNPATNKEEPWKIDKWVREKNYPWIAPGLLYKGDMTLPDHDLPMVWSTRFHTFSRYSPILLEGTVDVALRDEYLKTHPGTSASSPEKISKAGPSTKSTKSTTSYTPLVAASPALALPGPPERSPAYVDFHARAGHTTAYAMAATTSLSSAPTTGLNAESFRARRQTDTPRLATLAPHPRTHTAWQAIRKNADTLKLGDMQLKNPRLVTDGSQSHELPLAPPATGFLIEGTIKLFGLDHEVQLQSWHGPIPPNIQLGSEPPVYQRVQIDNIRPSEFIPLLENTPFSDFEFQRVTLTYQNYPFVKTLPLGWTITADIPIDEKHGAIYNILCNVLQIPEDGLQLQALASLGLSHSWSSRPNLANFVVRGLLKVKTQKIEGQAVPGIRLHEDVVLTRIGLLVYGVGTSTLGIESKRSMEYGFKIFGDMHIKVPGSVTPLELDFEIGEFGGVAELEASVKGGVWKNVFGTRINLDMVQLSTSFEWTKPLESLDFTLKAHLRAGSASALISGKYSAGGNYSISAYVQDLRCEGVADLFRHYTGEELSLPSHVDVTIGSATIEIAKGTGLSITDLMFIAASKDDPTLSSLNPKKYPIKKGVQFSACFDQVGPLNKLMRRDSFPGLLLSASWQSGASFLLDVVLPTNTMIHLGHGITTDPITLSINLEQLLLQIAAGIQVPVPKSATPLDFEASLTIEREEVKLEGEMKGVWKDPFGISDSVAIGPFLELGLAIDLLAFPLTGIPSSFSFAGGLTVGKSEGQVAVEISDDPSQELLSGKVKDFGIQDLVSFTRELTELDIPMPPNFIDFEDIELYMSSGVTLGTMVYPAGFSFNAALKIFGAQLNASAEVTGGTLKVNGSIQTLSIGPLHITGRDGKEATLSLQIGSAIQQLHVDGAISLPGSDVGITLQLEILPKPTFSFDFTLHFTDLLTFVVDAKMTGEIADLKNLGSSHFGFALHAVFEQHLIDYVREKVHDMLEALKKQADVAIQDAEDKVEAEEQNLRNGVQSAQNQLDADYQTWLEYSQKVHADSQKFIDNYMKKLHDLQGGVETQRQKYNAKLKDAEGAVQQANAERAAKMRDAEAAVTKAKNDWDAGVASAESKLESAKKSFQDKFGSAEEDIENAQRKVDSVQSEIDSVESRIRYCDDAHWWRWDLKAELTYQESKKLVLEGYKATADGVLWAAKQVLGGTEYLAVQGAIPTAQALVDAAGRTGDQAFKGAQAILRETDRATAGVLNDAESTLKTVQNDGDALIRGAESALNTFVTAQKDLLYAAQHAVDNLIHSSEWLAYQTASGALDAAKHATHALDVAKKALEAAKNVTDGTIT
ncbi:hypothetical protein FRC06_008959, partial [Ceratobasidium sp. 370]